MSDPIYVCDLCEAWGYDPELWHEDWCNGDAEDRAIYARYRGLCVICRSRAVCIHEQPPRSLNPDWQNQPENRYPLCDPCHRWIQGMPNDQAQSFLQNRAWALEKSLIFPG